VLRICETNEEETEKFFRLVLPVLIVLLLVISFGATIILQLFGDYQFLFKWSERSCYKVSIFHSSLIKDLLALKFREDTPTNNANISEIITDLIYKADKR